MGKEEKNGQTGVCQYCGQSMIIQTVGDNLTQGELDAKATDLCNCPEAQSERRKRERKEKVDKFVKKHFSPELSSLIHYAIKMVEQQDLVEYQSKLPDDRIVKIWLDNDQYLRIKIKKTEDEELKV